MMELHFRVVILLISYKLISTNAFQLFDLQPLNIVSLPPIPISVQCHEELEQLKIGLTSHANWAMQLIDAWGKVPAGVLDGNTMELGSYDECIAVKNGDTLRGKYCLANIPLLTETNRSSIGPSVINLGSCLTTACTAQDFDLIIRELFNKIVNITLNTEGNIVYEIACGTAEKVALDNLDLAALCIFIGIGILVIVSTFSDYWNPNLQVISKPLLVSFSLRSNLSQVLHIAPHQNSTHTIPCLHGMRCLSVIWILFMHDYLMATLSPNINGFKALQWQQTPFGMLTKAGMNAVDTFFFLSGLLLVIVNLSDMNKNNGKLNIPKFYIHRFLRLSPILYTAILFYMSLYRHMGEGPLWSIYTSPNQLCKDTWWATFLYIQNYAAPGEMCLGHAWYLAVDMQLYIVAPLILVSLWKWPRRTLAALCIAILLFSAILFIIVFVNNFSATAILLNLGQDIPELPQIYYSSHTRISPWLIGIIFGYFLYTKNGLRARLPCKILVWIGWVLSLLLLFTIIFVLYDQIQTDSKPMSPLLSAFYMSLSRIGWPLVLCWIIYACQNGYAGPINNLLSSRLWQPLSKLSFCVYIWHLIIETIRTATLKTNTYFSQYTLVQNFWADFGVTLLVSIFVHLLIEAPVQNLERLLFSKPKSPDKSSASMITSKQNLID